jgi:nitrogen fixation/metabolism regulation signal transduction histidine kinase
MVAQLVRRLANSLLLMGLLFVFLIITLYFVANTGEHLDHFGQLYQTLLFGTVLALIVIGMLILASVWRLISDVRDNVSGSRLTLKLVIVFVAMALLPMALVYSFSVRFLNSNIESWFDVEVERALDDALGLSRDSLNVYMRTRQKTTLELSNRLADVPPELAVLVLNELGSDSEASELTLIGADNRVIASTAFLDNLTVSPNRPADDIISRARNGSPYLSTDPSGDGELQVRSVVPVFSSDPLAGVSVLYAIYPIASSSSDLAANVQQSFRNYRQLAYLREPLKQSSVATLTLAMFLCLMMAVWAAFYAARRLMVPVHNLVDGTRTVAAGDYTSRLSSSGRDELGDLVDSFNAMTDQLERARASAASSQEQAERQRAYLELVLSRISSGVITLDEQHRIRTWNIGAATILQSDGAALEALDCSDYRQLEDARLQQFFAGIDSLLKTDRAEWSIELELSGESSITPLICRGASMRDEQRGYTGHVLVFDDISDVVEAQRNAAWSEVARRLAHEIKNPLTPIQLSAERLQRKYASKLQGDDAATLQKLTGTIVTQVGAMKSMVKAFAEYANAPSMEFKRTSINELISEISYLYLEGDEQNCITLALADHIPDIAGDANRIRQVLHNVIKNAFEAASDVPHESRRLTIATSLVHSDNGEQIEMRFQDNGPGFPQDLLDRLFEPYVTTKKKGTGIGLAIVKKIIEEHGGSVHASNPPEGGGLVSLWIPVLPNYASLHGDAA